MATVEDLYRQVLGREPDPEGKAFWESAFGGSVDPAEQASFMQSVQSTLSATPVEQQATLAPNLTTTSSTPLVVAKLTDQILSQGTTDQWSGQGYGSAQANAADMAKIIAATGVTDISQFGKVPAYEQVFDTSTRMYNGQRLVPAYNGDGTYSYGSYKGSGQYDGEGHEIQTFVKAPADAKLEVVYGVTRSGGDAGDYLEPVDQSKVKIIDGKPVVDTGQTTFGNKLTETPVANTYSELQTGNAFGGTFAGKGNTGYRVEFAPNGTPLFYTTGASSSDVPSWVVPALVLGGAYFGLDASGLLSGTAGGSLTAGITVADIAAAEAALAGATTAGGLLTAGSLTAGITPAQIAAAEAALPTSGLLSGSLTAGITPTQIAAGEAALPSAGGSLTAGITTADIAASEAGLPSAGSLTAGITTADIAASEAGLPAAVGSLTAGITPTNIAASEAGLPSASVSTNVGNILSNLTPNQIANIVGGFGGLLGGAALTSGGGTGGTGGVGALPTQGVPLNTADYYTAIQQNYNRLLPAVPRDVATPLAQWYNSQYGA